MRTVSVDGFMTYGEWENGQRFADFDSCEEVRMEPYCMKAKVQVMRDGFVYITEKKRRKRNKPIFREDHSSLSLGYDGKYYFYFAMPAEQAGLLPDQLVSEALAIAQKMANALLNAMEEEA